MIAELMAQLKQSMIEKNKLKKDVLQLVIAKGKGFAKDDLAPEVDEYFIRAIKSEMKQIKDSVDKVKEFEGEKFETLRSESKYKLEFLQGFLPKQLTLSEIEIEAVQAIELLEIEKTPKNMGVVMKYLKEKLGDSADGKLLSEAVKKAIS